MKQISIIGLLLVVTSVFADTEGMGNWRDDPLSPSFRLNYDKGLLARKSWLSPHGQANMGVYSENPILWRNEQQAAFNQNGTQLKQYDATFYYPFRRQGMNLDLGVNIKYIDGRQLSLDEDDKRQVTNFSAAIPMIYATALFDLPFKGLSAGFEGSLDYDNTQVFDYKAKFAYEWERGLGLQGGWQHQQLSLDNASTEPDYELKGPFLDIFLRF